MPISSGITFAAWKFLRPTRGVQANLVNRTFRRRHSSTLRSFLFSSALSESSSQHQEMEEQSEIARSYHSTTPKEVEQTRPRSLATESKSYRQGEDSSQQQGVPQLPRTGDGADTHITMADCDKSAPPMPTLLDLSRSNTTAASVNSLQASSCPPPSEMSGHGDTELEKLVKDLSDVWPHFSTVSRRESRADIFSPPSISAKRGTTSR